MFKHHVFVYVYIYITYKIPTFTLFSDVSQQNKHL